uniref:Uncharacterized protein LOC105851472 n=1 Tax=Cicer arietinum TaxID=3827 RepID=A0A1S3DWK6_CICAR|nr:uncharacterized protein LOC105851472 [Cicer arietinum]
MVFDNITLKDLMSKLNNLFTFGDFKRVDKIEYHCLSMDVDGCLRYTNFHLQDNNDVQTMITAFYHYETKGLIELDTMLSRSTHDILASLNRPRSIDDIMDCLVELDETTSLTQP